MNDEFELQAQELQQITKCCKLYGLNPLDEIPKLIEESQIRVGEDCDVILKEREELQLEMAALKKKLTLVNKGYNEKMDTLKFLQTMKDRHVVLNKYIIPDLVHEADNNIDKIHETLIELKGDHKISTP